MILDDKYLNWVSQFARHVPLTDEFRILKVMEEAGEVAQALIGARKLNPRKIDQDVRYHDVAMELGDVVMTALVAIVSLGFNPNDILTQQEDKTRRNFNL